MRGKINRDIVHGLASTLLAKGFDNAKTTPDFHLELWDLVCSEATHVAIAAPRG